MLASMATDWLVAARAEPFLPPISKNDPKYSFQIYLTHPRTVLFLEVQWQRGCQPECAVLSISNAVHYTSGQDAAGRTCSGLGMLTTPLLLTVALFSRTRPMVYDCYLIPAFVTLTLSDSICPYSLLARCSRTKIPFCLPVSFSADFNTRLSTRQYQYATG